MEIPSLNEHQFAVGKAEFSTGHVLRNDGSIYEENQSLNEMYEIFDSYEEAEEFVLDKIKNNPEVECWIVNANGDHINTFDKNGKRTYKTSKKQQ